jgi:very-short-patch-repair endonuclease
VHQTRHLPDDDVDQGVTTPVRTVLDCASTMPFRDALAIADSALSRSFIREQATLIGAAECTRGPGRTRRIRVGRLADWRADNPFESTLRAILLEAGITGFEPQLRIRLRHRTIYVDLGNEHLKIVIEADSFEFHGTRDALKRDTERYGELAAEGWIVLRFTYEHVMWRQDYVLEQIGVALRSRRSPFKTSARSSPPERTVRA